MLSKFTSPPLFLLLFLASWTPQHCHGARILGVMPSPAQSHGLILETLLQELSSRGHQATYLSSLPLQLTPRNSSTGLRLVTLNPGSVLKGQMGFIVSPERNALSESLALWKIAPAMCETLLSSPEFLTLIGDPETTFDLVIVEVFFFDCFIPLAHHYKAPLVLIISMWPPPWTHDMIGNPSQLAVSPNFFLPYGDHMNFWARTHNVMHTTLLGLARNWIFLPRQDVEVRKVFGASTPPLRALERNAVMLFSNTHPILNFARANVPGVIEIGGMHIKPAKPLPKMLKAWLDAYPIVTVVSLGSLINHANFPTERIQVLIKALGSLPCAVLWRWDSEDLPGLPSNVKIQSWLPQRDLLAHPHVKLLITHGGLLSGQEAVLEEVPRLVMPFFGDQWMNARRAEDLGIALSVNFHEATSEQLVKAAMKLLTEPSFKENAVRAAKIFRDQLGTSLDRAVFWTEYVIRHKGAPHLRSASLDLSWYQLHLLDVAAFVVLALVSLVVAICASCRALKRLCTSDTKKVDKTNKSK